MTVVKMPIKRWICVLSNLIASIWTCSICQIQATFPGVKFLRILFRFKKIKENDIRHCMSTSSINRQIRRFHIVVMQWTSKKCTKKRDARAQLLFWSLNLLFFWSRRCCRCRSCLSSLLSHNDSLFWETILHVRIHWYLELGGTCTCIYAESAGGMQVCLVESLSLKLSPTANKGL